MCTSPWRYFQNLFMGLGTGMVSCLAVTGMCEDKIVSFSANWQGTPPPSQQIQEEDSETLCQTTNKTSPILPLTHRATAWQNTKRNNRRQISNIWINLKNVNSVELNWTGIYLEAGHGVDFATENFLVEHCEMMDTGTASQQSPNFILYYKRRGCVRAVMLI